MLGRHGLLVGDHAEALQFYDRTLATEPAHDQALLGWTIAFGNLGRSQEAIDAATRAIELTADNPADQAEGYYWRAWNRHTRAQLALARADISAAKDRLPSPAVLGLAGIIEHDQGDLDPAQADLEAALAGPDQACTAQWYLALVHRQRKRWLPSGRAFEAAMACFRERAQVSAEQARRLQARGDLEPTYRARTSRASKRESHRLFPNEAFADLFADIGRASVPPRIVSVVMVLQRLEGLSDREAVDRITFDLRWKYAAGGLDFDYAGFVHTVLVDMRARLRRSERPNRIFETALEVAHQAGLIGRKRVLDSTALCDAVATQDTVTLIRSAIRALLRIVDEKFGAELRSCCKRDDDYIAPGKPSCDWDDVQAREALVDALARDAYAILAALDGRMLASEVMQAVKLVATVVGQDLEQRGDGMFRIARRVAKDRVISTVDPEARRGHKTAARGFDGYKGAHRHRPRLGDHHGDHRDSGERKRR